jgi:hypothetical protein
MTPSLRELQQAFAAGVLDDQAGVLTALRPLRFEPARHLQVYRNNTFANLTDALRAVYPVVERLVGAGFFDYLADQFIRSHPPRSGNLHDFGAELAGFVAGFEPARALVYLPDVAQLEWSWHMAFHAADAEPLDPARLAAFAPDQYGRLHFRLHPSAQLLASNYPILRVWEANQDGHDNNATIDLDAGGERLLVIRRRLDVLIERLGPGDYQLLDGCRHGAPFEAACGQALAAEPGFDLAATLRGHITRGTFTDLQPVSG